MGANMLVKAKTHFISTVYGEVTEGDQFDCDASMALQWEAAGMIEIPRATYDTKVIKETPAVANIPLDSGQDKESGSQPAVQASTPKTPRRSKAKKS